jgi:hypothetical protein
MIEFLDEDGRLKPECDVPPRVVVSAGGRAQHAATNHGGAGLRKKRRTWRVRLRCSPVDELDQMAEEAGSVAAGALKLVFGQASPVDILLKFASGDSFAELTALAREVVGLPGSRGQIAQRDLRS